MGTEPSPTPLIPTDDAVADRDATTEDEGAAVGAGDADIDVQRPADQRPADRRPDGQGPDGQGPEVDVADGGSNDERSGGLRSRRGRRVVLAIAAVVLVFVGYYLVNLWQVWATGRSDQARPVDAIVVMGAAQYDGRPSNQLAARLDHVVELWPEGLAPIVVVTGGNQPGDRFTEAEASARYLTERGVPEDAILMENAGSTTYESLEAVDILLAAVLAGDDPAGADDVRVLIVTDPYHSLRSRLIAQELGMTAYVSPTDTSVVTGGPSFRRHLQEAAGISVGRIIGFDRLSGLTG